MDTCKGVLIFLTPSFSLSIYLPPLTVDWLPTEKTSRKPTTIFNKGRNRGIAKETSLKKLHIFITVSLQHVTGLCSTINFMRMRDCWLSARSKVRRSCCLGVRIQVVNLLASLEKGGRHVQTAQPPRLPGRPGYRCVLSKERYISLVNMHPWI